jgi:NADH:ubiquinone oxidoreductase subunit F (NADH-binding)
VTAFLTLRASPAGEVTAVVGPRLLAGLAEGPGLREHRRRWPSPRRLHEAQLLGLLDAVTVHGRGGAGFPFALKVRTAVESGKRRAVVVNASEGEPGSAKDSSLLVAAPHLVIDGAQAVAQALGADTVHVVVGHDRPAARLALEVALAERDADRADHLPRVQVHVTRSVFVGGQERAVLELLEGRDNLPVTSWTPAAVAGLRGRPTLLSNAETYAQVGALLALGPAGYAELGTPTEPGTTLLTVAGDGPHGVVLEVPFGVGLGSVLEYCGYAGDAAVLLGGYHGTWVPPGHAPQLPVSRRDLAAARLTLGAGVVLPLDAGTCPISVTAGVTAYLAGASAGRCGPCRNGLPALAQAVAALADGAGRVATRRIQEIAGVLPGRGACAHPDGSVRLVASMLTAFPEEIRAHELGTCEAVLSTTRSTTTRSTATTSTATSSTATRSTAGTGRRARHS